MSNSEYLTTRQVGELLGLPHQRLVIGKDRREQLGYLESELGLPVVDVTMDTGDYCIAASHQAGSHYAIVERKSLQDAISCCTSERERFERELVRMRAYPARCLVIESSWEEIERGEWRSKATPSVIIGSLLAWMNDGLPVILAGNRERAAKHTARFLYTAARRRWRECRAFAANIIAENEAVA
jgi:ERCC4-type nuclease